jgi:hypothetical protein
MFIENIDSECKRTEVRLRLVHSELRPITGTPIKDEADRLRRMALWRELDALVRSRDAARGKRKRFDFRGAA